MNVHLSNICLKPSGINVLLFLLFLPQIPPPKKNPVQKWTQNVLNKAGIKPSCIEAGIMCTCKKKKKKETFL